MRIVTGMKPLVARQLSPINGREQSQITSPNSSVTVAFVVMSAVILMAIFFLLYRLRLSRSNRRKSLARLGANQPLLTLGIRSRPGAMLTRLVEIRRSTSPGPTNHLETPEESRPLSVIDIRPPSVIDISPINSKRGPTRRPAPLSLNTSLVSNERGFVRTGGLSRSFLFSPMVAQGPHPVLMHSPLDKPLPETPSAFGPTYPPQALQSPGCFVRSEAYSPAILSSTTSSWYNSRWGSDSSLAKGTISSPRPETYANSQASPIPFSVATGSKNARFPSRLVDERNGSGTRALNVLARENEIIDSMVSPWQNPRATRDQIWFDRAPGKKRLPPRLTHHRMGDSLPGNLENTNGSLAAALSRSLSTSTNHGTPPPPPYTPLDMAFGIPSLPQKARVVSESSHRARYSAPHDSASIPQQQRQVPRPLPPINRSQAFLVSESDAKAPDLSDCGASLGTRRRSNSLPAEDGTSANVPIWGGAHTRLDTLRFSRFTFEMPESVGGRQGSSSRGAHKITPAGEIPATFNIDV